MSGVASLYAAGAATCFALGSVCAKQGLVDTSAISGLLVSLGSGVTVLVIAVAADPPNYVDSWGVVLFAAAGVLAPSIGRLAGILGIERLGASRSVPIQTATYPLLATLGASSWLGEDIGMERYFGIVLIIIGIGFLTRSRRHKVRSVYWTPSWLFPVMAGAAYGAGDLVRKVGLGRLEEPTLGAAVSVVAALSLWLVLATAVPSLRRKIGWGPGAAWFVLNGILASTAILLLFHALRVGTYRP